VDDGGIPIAASALEKGVRVVSTSGHEFGTVERVLEDSATGIFHGIVVSTASGPRLVDRDHVERMTTTQVSCTIGDDEVAELPVAPAVDPDEDAGRPAPRSWAPSWSEGGPVEIVRCSRGGVFQTIWIPMMSFKAIRLGRHRIQWCPVHERRELVERVDPATLTNAELAQAAAYPPSPIP
jgi:hypothetical protein